MNMEEESKSHRQMSSAPTNFNSSSHGYNTERMKKMEIDDSDSFNDTISMGSK